MVVPKNVILGENAGENKRKILKKIKRNEPMFGVYLITIPSNNVGTLEIYPYLVLLQEQYKNNQPDVVAIAKGKDEAYEVVKNLVTDCYNHTQCFDMEEYLRGRRN